jgi:hypothetical protein
MVSKPELLVAVLVVLLVTAAVSLAAWVGPLSADELTDIVAFNLGLVTLLPEPVLDPLTYPPRQFRVVKPQEFDPARTNLVQSAWLEGIGCPANAFIAIPNEDFTGVAGS